MYSPIRRNKRFRQRVLVECKKIEIIKEKEVKEVYFLLDFDAHQILTSEHVITVRI